MEAPEVIAETSESTQQEETTRKEEKICQEEKSHQEEKICLEEKSHQEETTPKDETPQKDETTQREETTQKKDEKGLGSQVASHYNQLPEAGLSERTKSRIFHLRNFNNWMKSVLIGEFLREIRKTQKTVNVLDLCAGKGGDLLKWKKGDIDHIVCADIAGTSVEQCETRYKELIDRSRRDRHPQKMFTAEFITADCTKEQLKPKYKDPNMLFDIVSCQFSFHYSFESYKQADMMLRNACECLRPGGLFIGTTPNAYELVKRWRNTEGNKFGNDVYSITFESDDKDNIPLFGAQYMFHLEGVVDCPEFLVYFPAMMELASKYGMEPLCQKSFGDFYEQHITSGEHRSLIGKMQALECYPNEDEDQASSDPSMYANAKETVDRLQAECQDERKKIKVGTLSKDEWEAACLYTVFAFKKTDEEETTLPSPVKLKRPAEESEEPESEPKVAKTE